MYIHAYMPQCIYTCIYASICIYMHIHAYMYIYESEKQMELSSKFTTQNLHSGRDSGCDVSLCTCICVYMCVYVYTRENENEMGLSLNFKKNVDSVQNVDSRRVGGRDTTPLYTCVYIHERAGKKWDCP